MSKTQKIQNWTDFFALQNWVQNEGSLSGFCIAQVIFIRKNTVTQIQSIGSQK